MSVRRAAGAAVLAISAGALVTGSWAWACTPLARAVSTTAEAGPPQSAIGVRGEGATPQAPVELRWDGVRGPVIAATTADDAGRFASQVRIPEAPPGVHTIVVVTEGAGVGRVPFEVTSASASTARAPSAVWSTSSPSPASSRAGGLGAGALVLALGTVGLAGGTAAAVVVRRRALAAADGA